VTTVLSRVKEEVQTSILAFGLAPDLVNLILRSQVLSEIGRANIGKTKTHVNQWSSLSRRKLQTMVWRWSGKPIGPENL